VGFGRFLGFLDGANAFPEAMVGLCVHHLVRGYSEELPGNLDSKKNLRQSERVLVYKLSTHTGSVAFPMCMVQKRARSVDLTRLVTDLSRK
jgi:hypothetical protein